MLALADQGLGLVLQIARQPTCAEIERAIQPERRKPVAGHGHDGFAHRRRRIGRQDADARHRVQQRSIIADQPGGQQRAISVADVIRHHPRRAEVEQHQPARVQIIAIIGEVGIGLHHPPIEQFGHEDAQHQRHQPVAFGLGQGGGLVDGDAFHVAHGQYGRARQVGGELWHHHLRPIGGKRAIAGQHLAFAGVVCLFVQLALGFVQQRFHRKTRRQQARKLYQRRHIVDIGINAGRDAGILHLDRQIAPIQCHGAVDLADRGRRNRRHVEPLELRAPVRPPAGHQHLLQLLFRHRIGFGAQASENVGQFARQHLAAVHRNQLPQLHRRAAQPREFVGQALGIGGIEQQAGQIGPLTLQHLARAATQHIAGDAASQPAKARQTRQAGGRNSARAGGEHGASMPYSVRQRHCGRLPPPETQNGRLKACRQCSLLNGDPYGTRTRVFAVKGRRPRPLDEGASSERPPVIGLGPWRQPLK